MKISKKAHSMVVLSELSSLFVKISICDALSSHDLFNDISECVTLQLKETEQLKLLSSAKVLLVINLSQKAQVSSVECWNHCDEIKTIS